jgi:hypothetical protein
MQRFELFPCDWEVTCPSHEFGLLQMQVCLQLICDGSDDLGPLKGKNFRALGCQFFLKRLDRVFDS